MLHSRVLNSNIEEQADRSSEFTNSLNPFPSTLDILGFTPSVFKLHVVTCLKITVSDLQVKSINTPLSPLAALL